MPDSTALNATNCARVSARDQPRERRLAGARRAPEDDRLQAIVLDRLAQRPAGPSSASWPTNSSSVRGRIRSASGAECVGRAASGARARRTGTSDRDRRAVARLRRGSARPAIATFSDSTGGRIGIVTRIVGRVDQRVGQAARPRRRAGAPAGARRSHSRQRRAAARNRGEQRDPAQPALPRQRRAAIGCATAIGSRNVLPIAPRSAFQPNGSAVPAVVMTPVAPQASAAG